MQSVDPTGSSIDLVFLTYWLPPVKGAQLVMEKDIQCISDKLTKALASKGKLFITFKQGKTLLLKLLQKKAQTIRKRR